VSDIWRYSLTQNYEIKIWVVDVAFPQAQRAGTPGIGPAAHDDEHCVGIDRANVPLTQRNKFEIGNRERARPDIPIEGQDQQ
jgi:hypothetical protein